MMHDHDQLEALRRAQEEDNPVIDAGENEGIPEDYRARFDDGTNNPVDPRPADLAWIRRVEERIANLEAHTALRRTELKERISTLEARMDNVPHMLSDLRDEAWRKAVRPIAIHYPPSEPDLVVHRKAVEIIDRHHQAQRESLAGPFPRPMGPTQIEERAVDLHRKLQVADALIESKDVRLKEKDYQIEDLEKRVAELEGLLSERNRKVSDLVNEVQGLRKKEQDLDNLEKENEGQRVTINRLRGIMKNQNRMLKELKDGV